MLEQLLEKKDKGQSTAGFFRCSEHCHSVPDILCIFGAYTE